MHTYIHTNAIIHKLIDHYSKTYLWFKHILFAKNLQIRLGVAKLRHKTLLHDLNDWIDWKMDNDGIEDRNGYRLFFESVLDLKILSSSYNLWVDSINACTTAKGCTLVLQVWFSSANSSVSIVQLFKFILRLELIGT